MEIFNLSADKVTSDMRTECKNCEFWYNIRYECLWFVKELNLSVGEAQNYIDNYFAKYSAVKTYISNTMEKVRKRWICYNNSWTKKIFP